MPPRARPRRTARIDFRDTRRLVARAASCGFADDDTRGLLPERAEVEAAVLAHLDRYRALFVARPAAFLAAWPIATFDPLPAWRDRAAQAVAAHQAALAALRDPREALRFG